MRRFAYWLFPLTAAAVAVFIVIFMIRINTSVPSSEQFLEEEHNPLKTPEPIKGSWIDRFSVNAEKEHFYPINEVHLELDMGETPQKTDSNLL